MDIALPRLAPLVYRLAGRVQSVLPQPVAAYRQGPGRHADGTAWRTDGRSGYAWLFCTPSLSLFLFRVTRSAAVPTVIPRKLSFGSQSDAGARTREILMRALHTLRKRRAGAQAHFKWVLAQLAANPPRDPFALLFPSDTS